MSDLDDLTKLIHDETCMAGANCREPRKVHNMADPHWVAVAIIKAGWTPPRRSDLSYQTQHLGRHCSDGDCVRDNGHDGQHYNIAGQPL